MGEQNTEIWPQMQHVPHRCTWEVLVTGQAFAPHAAFGVGLIENPQDKL